MLSWALLVLSILFVIVAYIVIQGTRAALAWRKAAAEGDTKVIRDIVEDAIGVWRSTKRPKEVPVETWRGIQTMELVEVAPDLVRVSCQAESEYRMTGGRWIEMKNPLQEGLAITARAADMLLYELPHFKAERVQIDVYTTYRETESAGQRGCILSTVVSREAARDVDWEEWTPQEIVDALGGRYRLAEHGQPLPIEVAPVASLAENEDASTATAAS